jgi:hypothetical protein
MDINLADQRIFVLEENLSAEEIRQKAMDRRSSAFVSGLGSLLSRPKPDDIVLLTTQRRLEPFWHVACRARFVYDRSHEYFVPASGAEVKAVTINGATYDVSDTAKPRTYSMHTLEHCKEETFVEEYTDGVSGGRIADGATVVGKSKHEVSELAGLEADETIVVPPEQRASYVVREALAKLMRPVQADSMEEESFTLEHTDLYLRPIRAFEFHWKPKDRKGIVEIDCVTGETRQGKSLITDFSKMVTRDSLFDIGADTISMLVPGGGIAVKVAKIAIDQSHK